MKGPSSGLHLYRRLLLQARARWLHLGGILIVALLAPPIALLAPLPLRVVVDSAIGAHPLPHVLEGWLPGDVRSATAVLLLAAGLTVGIALLVQLQALASWLLVAYTGERLLLEFRGHLFAHVQRLSLAYHDTKGTTDSTYRIQYDAPSIQWILVNATPSFVASGFTLAGMVYVVARIDWSLALIAMAVVPVLFTLMRLSQQRLRSQWYEAKEHESSAMSVVQEALAAARVVKAFGQEGREHRRFVRHASRGVRSQIKLALIGGGFDLLVGVTIGLATALTLLIGGSHVRAGTLSLGQFLMVMAYLVQLYNPLQMVTKAIASLQGSMVGAERAFALLDQVPDVAERDDARPIARAAGAVTFRNVSFAYGNDRAILEDISFDVRPGTSVGIMGTTGAGKTTLTNLLTRFYDPTSGSILLDGVDLREYRLVDLRNQFALVLQEPVLFSTSIAENIAYARPGAAAREIIEAARQANAHEFITRLPQGYDSQVGERGHYLSGGERQRISLARAFLKNGPILILDEPTSSVDSRTEVAILDAIERLMRGRTTFLIAHRTSTLRRCETMLVIERGRLVTFGPSALAPAGDVLRTIESR